MIRHATVSQFGYSLNVGRSDGASIPLGVVMLFRDDAEADSHLVLLGRTELSAGERGKMDWAAQKILANPFDFLKKELDTALAERVSDDIFIRLANKFTWSIAVSPAIDIAIPNEIEGDIAKSLAALMRHAKPVRGQKKVASIRSHAMKVGAGIVPNAFARVAGPAFPCKSVRVYAPRAWAAAARHHDRERVYA